MLLYEKIKGVETFLSLGLLTRHCVNPQNCDLSAVTAQANPARILICVTLQSSQQWSLLGGLCVLQHTGHC